MLTEKARMLLEGYAIDLFAALPEGWALSHAFHDAYDDLEFYEDAGHNYLTGCLRGAADALEVDVLDLLHELGFGEDRVQNGEALAEAV